MAYAFAMVPVVNLLIQFESWRLGDCRSYSESKLEFVFRVQLI